MTMTQPVGKQTTHSFYLKKRRLFFVLAQQRPDTRIFYTHFEISKIVKRLAIDELL